jgi:hypothetical protein
MPSSKVFACPMNKYFDKLMFEALKYAQRQGAAVEYLE